MRFLYSGIVSRFLYYCSLVFDYLILKIKKYKKILERVLMSEIIRTSVSLQKRTTRLLFLLSQGVDVFFSEVKYDFLYFTSYFLFYSIYIKLIKKLLRLFKDLLKTITFKRQVILVTPWYLNQSLNPESKPTTGLLKNR